MTQNLDLRITPDQLEDLECSNCQTNIWQKIYQMKTVSPLLTGTGQRGVVPIEFVVCGRCGTPLEETLKKFEAPETERPSKIITGE